MEPCLQPPPPATLEKKGPMPAGIEPVYLAQRHLSLPQELEVFAQLVTKSRSSSNTVRDYLECKLKKMTPSVQRYGKAKTNEITV